MGGGRARASRPAQVERSGGECALHRGLGGGAGGPAPAAGGEFSVVTEDPVSCRRRLQFGLRAVTALCFKTLSCSVYLSPGRSFSALRSGGVSEEEQVGRWGEAGRGAEVMEGRVPGLPSPS